MVSFGLIMFMCVLASGHGKISLTSNGPVVIGATITFKASLTDDFGHRPDGTYQFKWIDNAIPPHSYTAEGEFTVSYWNVTYPREIYSPGTYEVQVVVSRKFILIDWIIGSSRLYFDLTALLNGKMNMTQNNKTVQSNVVSTASEVSHYIHFIAPDQEYLTKNATSVITYWFVDCIYYGATSDLTFKFNYSNAADQERHVEALVVASFEPLPPPPIPTTTPAPITTTTSTTLAPTPTPTSTPATTPTTAKTTIAPTPSNNITAVVQPNLKLGSNVSEIHILPYVCLNTSFIPPDPKKTYGYFYGKVTVRAPVSNVVVTGNDWLQHGDILNLTVSCNGSGAFLYCFQITEGEYNVTGNESCSKQTLVTECKMRLVRYFHYSGTYTVLVIINNEVSKKVTLRGVHIYEVKKHPQLSVIVVPVAFSAIAVTLIVFGAAYYMQSRHRYTIEVADFDFAQASDLEYMTFSQRLKAAFNSALTRTHDLEPNKIDDNKSNKSCDSTSTASTTASPSTISHM